MRVVAIQVRCHVGVARHPHVTLARTPQSHLVLLFPLHPSVAKPNLDLLLRHAKRVCNLYSSSSRQIPDDYFVLQKSYFDERQPVEMEFLF